MRFTPNLAFGGQCEAAFKFYERCFEGKIVFMLTYGKSPMAEQVPPRWREKIFHATLAASRVDSLRPARCPLRTEEVP
jgi:PhnB protein